MPLAADGVVALVALLHLYFLLLEMFLWDKPAGLRAFRQTPEQAAATKVLANTRLKPNETRELNYDIPAANVAVVRAEALYNVLAPPLIAQMGDKLPKEMTANKVAATAEFWR